MSSQDDTVQEILRGIDGLLMLSGWETTLLKDIRSKTEGLLDGAGSKGRTGRKGRDLPASDDPPDVQ